MTIQLNGPTVEVDDAVTVASLLQQRGQGARGSAAVVDGEVVPRGDWPTRTLQAGAVVEVITAVQGG